MADTSNQEGQQVVVNGVTLTADQLLALSEEDWKTFKAVFKEALSKKAEEEKAEFKAKISKAVTAFKTYGVPVIKYAAGTALLLKVFNIIQGAITIVTILQKIIQNKKVIIIILGVLILAFVGWYMFSTRSISNNGSGADNAQSDIRSASDKQSDAIGRVDSVESRLDDSSATVGNVSGEIGAVSGGIGDSSTTISTVQERLDDSEARLDRNTDLIKQGKLIVNTVQKRSPVGTN